MYCGAGLGNVVEDGLFVRGETLHGVDQVRDQVGAALQDDVHLRPIGFYVSSSVTIWLCALM